MTDPLFKERIPEKDQEREKAQAADKEFLEKMEEDRNAQAQKDKVSFSFSWIAIVVRGIVGTFISVFVFTQANRIEDEDSMARFTLLADYNATVVEEKLDNTLKDLRDAANLRAIAPNLSEKDFTAYLVHIVSERPYLDKIDWIPAAEITSLKNEKKSEALLQAAESGGPTSFVSIPESTVKALAGTSIKLFVPSRDSTTKKLLGIVAAKLSLSDLVYQSIHKNNRYATDIFVYSEEKAPNQLLYFFNAEVNLDRLPPSRPQELILSPFMAKKTIYFADKKLLFVYNATPAFLEHTWQATIAAGIGVFITSFIVVTAWILLEIEKRQFSNVLHEEHIQEIEGTVDLLETTKNRLVAQENLASLGGLTAGIAHEIKNPLNFINNFSTLSVELVEEIDRYINQSTRSNNPEELEDVLDSIDTLKENLNTIHEQGQRADSTIQRMLAHSRGKPGEWAMTDIHKLLEEYLTFSYHGMRAKNSNFNVKIEKEFSSDVKEIRVVTNDLSRVFLNLMNNAFQAIDEKAKHLGSQYANPTLTVRTQNVGKYLRIRIHDNGMGISKDNRSKIFTPFFTTKPTGVGTGLGLSLSYNIIVREHGGSLTFESEEGSYTEFIITIPMEPKSNQEELIQ